MIKTDTTFEGTVKEAMDDGLDEDLVQGTIGLMVSNGLTGMTMIDYPIEKLESIKFKMTFIDGEVPECRFELLEDNV